MLKLATWNVRGLENKEHELTRELKKKHINNIAVVSETKKKMKGTKEIDDYTFIYSGVEQTERARKGIAIMTDKKWKNTVLNYTYVNERILTIRLKIDREHSTITGVYAPEEGKKEETKKFYEDLQKESSKYNKSDHLLVAGDLKDRVAQSPTCSRRFKRQSCSVTYL
jgi:exonuclease III